MEKREEVYFVFEPSKFASGCAHALHLWLMEGDRQVDVLSIERFPACVFTPNGPRPAEALVARVDALVAEGKPVNVRDGWREGGWCA